jgi:molecular chaperone DnaJ
MTRKEAYETLSLRDGADLDEIKRAYRKLAFALHPDLHPGKPGAARRFQRVNEAYALLNHAFAAGASSSGDDAASARAREEAHRAYKARQGPHGPSPGPKTSNDDPNPGKDEVLRDILNDPFARRVFEDIYDHLRQRGAGAASEPGPVRTRRSGGADVKKPAAQEVTTGSQRPQEAHGVLGKVRGWLRRQIDDEQVLRLPGAALAPGAKVRLEIQHGFSGEPQVVELTLPPEFAPGKAMRLKGMGKRIGKFKGDLYVKIEPA